MSLINSRCLLKTRYLPSLIRYCSDAAGKKRVKVYFDVAADGKPTGRIVMEVILIFFFVSSLKKLI